MYMSVCFFTHICTHRNTYIPISILTAKVKYKECIFCICACVHMCICTCMYIYIFVYMHIHIHIHTYMYIYIYTHTQTLTTKNVVLCMCTYIHEHTLEVRQVNTHCNQAGLSLHICTIYTTKHTYAYSFICIYIYILLQYSL